MTFSVGIDIGGTKTNIGIVDSDLQIKDHRVIRTRPEVDESIETLVDRINLSLSDMLDKNGIQKGKVEFVGICVPGTVNGELGIVEYCPNLGWNDIKLKSIFQERTGFTYVRIIQDSWAAAVAEHECGGGKNCSDMACITIGTGIGCGVILNNRIFSGAMHCAGELGHTIFQMDGIACNCSRRGCFERYVSGTGIYERAFERFPEKFRGRPHCAETVFELAMSNYEPATELIDMTDRMLAIGISNLISIINVKKVLISGGISQQEDLIIKPLQKYIYDYAYYPWKRQKNVIVEKAQIGESAPMLGAALLYRVSDYYSA